MSEAGAQQPAVDQLHPPAKESDNDDEKSEQRYGLIGSLVGSFDATDGAADVGQVLQPPAGA